MVVRSVSTFALKGRGEPSADNFDIAIPVLVNVAALAQGEELRVHWSAAVAAKADKRAGITWASQARQSLSKQQRRGR